MKTTFVSMLAVLAMLVVGCESNTPNSSANNNQLDQRGQATLDQMMTQDAGLKNVLDNAYGYAVFPEVGKGAVGVGGASGHGVAYEQGRQVGTASLQQGSIGPQIGGETYAELVVFKTPEAMNVFKNGNLVFGADASATLIKAGAAAAGQFNNGTRIFLLPKGGLMAGASINGQKFNYWTNGNEARD